MKSTEICGECNGTGWREWGEISGSIYGPCDACDAIGPLPTEEREEIADAVAVALPRAGHYFAKRSDKPNLTPLEGRACAKCGSDLSGHPYMGERFEADKYSELPYDGWLYPPCNSPF